MNQAHGSDSFVHATSPDGTGRIVALVQVTSVAWADESGGSANREGPDVTHAQGSGSFVHATSPDGTGRVVAL